MGGWLVPKESRALHLSQGSLCHSGGSVEEGSRFTSAGGAGLETPNLTRALLQVLSHRVTKTIPQVGTYSSLRGDTQAESHLRMHQEHTGRQSDPYWTISF